MLRRSLLTHRCDILRPETDADGDEVTGRQTVARQVPCKLFRRRQAVQIREDENTFSDVIVDGMWLEKDQDVEIGDTITRVSKRNGESLRDEEFQVIGKYPDRAVIELQIRGGSSHE